MVLVSNEKSEYINAKPHMFRPKRRDVVQKHVLVVDDEEDTLRFLEKNLETEGFTVSLAFDGLSALDIAIQKQPDIILLDIMMPIMSGYEVFEQLRSTPETAHIPIIFISSAYTAEVVRKSQAMGAAGYIAKPFAPRELVEQIRKIIGEE